MARSLVALLLVTFFLGACANQQRVVDSASVKPDKPPEILIVKEDSPPLKSFKSGRDELNNLMKVGNQVGDEVKTISLPLNISSVEDAVASSLKNQYDISAVSSVKSGGGFANLVKARGLENGYIVNTKITEWDATAHPKSRERYNLYLTAETQVYDVAAKKIIGRYTCRERRDFDKPKDAPGRYKLMKDDMKLLKSMMSELTKSCATATVGNIF